MTQTQKVQLMLGDVDAIKAFVYESNALPDIRGSSEILVELEGKVSELLKQHIGDDDLIYCGGGSFLAIVPEGMVENLKQAIERLYLDRTKTATITVVYSEPITRSDLEKGIPPNGEQVIRNLKGKGIAEDLLFSHFDTLVENGDRLKRKNFGEWVAWLSSKLQQAKRQKVFAPFFPTLPVHERCQACGKRAVSDRDNLTGEMLCSICWEKRFEGRRKRRTFVKEFAKWTKKKGVEMSNAEERVPKDLDTLAGSEGRIAFLYADGNNMGDLLQRMKTPDEYRQLSNTLSTATKEALFEAIWEAFGEEQLTHQTLPFEIIAVGGDDVVVIVPSRHGWKLALKFLEEFEKQTQNLRQEHRWRLTMSAGLVIADVKYPVRFMMDLAEGLLKQAKGLARETKESTICHLWLRSPIASENAKAIIEAIYHRKTEKQEMWLTARPFTLKQAKHLGEIAQELKNLPSSQRRLLAEGLNKGVRTSLNLALYQASKRYQEAEKLLKVFSELGELLGNDVKDMGIYFWRQKESIWRTALLDALELVELDAV